MYAPAAFGLEQRLVEVNDEHLVRVDLPGHRENLLHESTHTVVGHAEVVIVGDYGDTTSAWTLETASECDAVELSAQAPRASALVGSARRIEFRRLATRGNGPCESRSRG